MSTPEPSTADQPFPGARSQVPGARREPTVDAAARSTDRPPKALPLGSTPTRSEYGWSARLAVRAEHVSVEKQTVVYERVLVRRHEIQDQAHLQSSVRKEKVRVSTEGDARLPAAADDSGDLKKSGRAGQSPRRSS